MGAKHVIITGDSISNYYTPFVRESLAGREVEIEQFYAGDSSQVLEGLPNWVGGKQPDLIQVNCGLHDARFRRDSQTYQQPIANYEANLRRIAEWLKANTSAQVLWASTTPVVTERIAGNVVRFERDILAYNAVGRAVMDEAGIPIDDLYAAVAADSTPDCVGPDGVHMTERGNTVLARAVVLAIEERLPQLSLCSPCLRG